MGIAEPAVTSSRPAGDRRPPPPRRYSRGEKFAPGAVLGRKGFQHSDTPRSYRLHPCPRIAISPHPRGPARAPSPRWPCDDTGCRPVRDSPGHRSRHPRAQECDGPRLATHRSRGVDTADRGAGRLPAPGSGDDATPRHNRAATPRRGSNHANGCRSAPVARSGTGGRGRRRSSRTPRARDSAACGRGVSARTGSRRDVPGQSARPLHPRQPRRYSARTV